MGNGKNLKNGKKRKKIHTGKKEDQTSQGFGAITKNTFREAMFWILAVGVLAALYAVIMGRPVFFTIHRSLYVIGMALGIYAILESIIKKERGLKDQKDRQQEGERVRRIRNIGIYRGFMVMGAAFILELVDYFIL